MKTMLAACVVSMWTIAVQAQGTSVPQPPTINSPRQTPVTAEPPKRNDIAPIMDIRIQGDGISLPKGVGDAPPPENPLASPAEKPAEKPPAK
jgi:hypothetical protein